MWKTDNRVFQILNLNQSALKTRTIQSFTTGNTEEHVCKFIRSILFTTKAKTVYYTDRFSSKIA